MAKVAAETIGIDEKIQRTVHGYQTMLSHELTNEGTLFSGGELQKIALSRIYVLDHDLYILDEPTSALDPVASLSFLLSTNMFLYSNILMYSNRIY
jgi:ATP-binding cassette, subfamily B, bacterial